MALFWIMFLLSAMAAIDHNRFVMAKTPLEIGVCYGLLGNDLPPSTEVVELFKKYGITRTRLYDPNLPALEALRGRHILVTLGIRNEDLQGLAASPAVVDLWFAAHVQPHLNDVEFDYIAVGNEVVPGDLGIYVLPVMKSLQNMLVAKNLTGIRVTTVVPANALRVSYPPSAGAFSVDASRDIAGILQFLSAHQSPLMINVYPYFAHVSDPVNVRLDYAQFAATEVVVRDGKWGYSNLFDAMVDAFYSAMERVGVTNVSVVVSESGWPSAGNGNFTTPALAATYNRNFVKHIAQKQGTPKRPNITIEGYIFAMFNENQKPEGVEQNFGLFYPRKEPVYPVFTPAG
ncbi:Lichenase [Morella rubra]|uniref:glucan endo-1,3-beta-D-glucosidase n=1 Tax=Morella rubra TaxID=262757 RepID=A0A6A1V9Y1_9ROSI|nr:Lichenase [Morella rubra]